MKYLEIKVTYKVITPLRLPKFSGFMIRGILGEKLKKLSCIHRQNPLKANCKTCKYIKTCPYGWLYELGKDFSRHIMYSVPPVRPWSLNVMNKEIYESGEYFGFSIYIFDKNPWYIDILSKALQEIDEIGRDRKRGFGKIRMDNIQINRRKLDRYKYIRDRIRVGFITPTHIVREGYLKRNPTLYDIMITGGRRFFLIKEIYYGKRELMNNLPKLSILKNISEVVIKNVNTTTITRWSEKKKRKEKFEGIVGNITYNLTRGLDKNTKKLVEEIISFSNIYGLGKRVTTGMGRVRITSY